MSFRKCLARAIRTAVLCTLPFAALPLLPVSQDVASPAHGAAAQYVSAQDEQRATRIEALLAENDCDLPADVIPGHAVVTVHGRTRIASGDTGFAIWLGPDDTERTGDEAPGTVHGFCR